MKRACERCSFYARPESGRPLGTCRVNAPARVSAKEAASDSARLAWPEVRATDWCGRFVEARPTS